MIKHITIIVISAAVVSLPQLLYWKSVTGKLVYFSYTGEWFDFFSPHFYEGLFGWKAGWIYHFPIAIIGVFGLVLLFCLRKRDYSIPILLFSLFHIWLILSWSSYWYGSYMGNRGFTEYQMILAIPFGFLIQESIKIRWKVVPLIVVLASILLSSIGIIRVLQINQWLWGMPNMSPSYTKANYFTLDATKTNLLLPNEGDEAFKINLLNNGEYYSNHIIYLNDFELSYSDKQNNSFHTSVLKIDSSIVYSKSFNIDGVTGRHQKPENGIELSLETFSKDRVDSSAKLIVEFTNATGKVSYYYNQLPIELKPSKEWKKTNYLLDLPEKRFNDDKLKVYVYNPKKANFELDNLSVRLYIKIND